MLTTNEILRVICLGALLLTILPAEADALKSAHRLLAVGSVRKQFETQTELQARAILRHYDSILATSTTLVLPATIKSAIIDCYERVYAWDNFEPGIAQIFAHNLSEKELELLIDFYSNLGLAPGDIENFRTIIAKANSIQAQSLDYLFVNSASCVETDAELILDYVATQRAAGLVHADD